MLEPVPCDVATRAQPAANRYQSVRSHVPGPQPGGQGTEGPKSWRGRPAGYLLTSDLVAEIAAGAALMPQAHRLFKLEDIAMGSWIEFIQQERGIKVRILRLNFRGLAQILDLKP